MLSHPLCVCMWPTVCVCVHVAGPVRRYKLEQVSAGRNYTKICKAITSGFFFHAGEQLRGQGVSSPLGGGEGKGGEGALHHTLLTGTSVEACHGCKGGCCSFLL